MKKLLDPILWDIDYFKNYNDTHGHLRGDNCLHKVAQAIAHQVTTLIEVADKALYNSKRQGRNIVRGKPITN